MGSWVAIVLLVVVCILQVVISNGCGHVCSDPTLGPVLGGVDFVQLKYLVQNKVPLPELPVMGSSQFVATLGSYKFWFQSEDNKNKFNSNPKEFYPQLGLLGFS